MLRSLWGSGAGQANLRQMSELISVGEFSVLWRKSARRTRSLALKIDRNGQLIAMTPLKTPEREVRRFVQSRGVWVKEQLAQFAALQREKDQARGTSLWFLGEKLDIQPKIGRKNDIVHDINGLSVISRQPISRELLDRRVKKWLRDQAGQWLPEQLQMISARTGLAGNGLQIKSYTARWGSCRHDGFIQLNWKLVMAPIEVIEYVIVHELCHLENFNHSKRFWAQVAQHCPTYKTHRKWLKQNGRLLISEP